MQSSAQFDYSFDQNCSVRHLHTGAARADDSHVKLFARKCKENQPLKEHTRSARPFLRIRNNSIELFLRQRQKNVVGCEFSTSCQERIKQDGKYHLLYFICSFLRQFPAAERRKQAGQLSARNTLVSHYFFGHLIASTLMRWVVYAVRKIASSICPPE